MKKRKDMIKIDGIIYKRNVFIMEEEHPAIGRILIVEGVKFKILDEHIKGPHKQGTFMAKLTGKDEEIMQEYDDALDLLSEKLIKKVDIKKIIKENLKTRPFQDLKTGLFILEAEDKGEDIDEEELKGCYQKLFHYKNHTFCFVTGSDVEPLGRDERYC